MFQRPTISIMYRWGKMCAEQNKAKKKKYITYFAKNGCLRSLGFAFNKARITSSFPTNHSQVNYSMATSDKIRFLAPTGAVRKIKSRHIFFLVLRRVLSLPHFSLSFSLFIVYFHSLVSRSRCSSFKLFFNIADKPFLRSLPIWIWLMPITVL